MMALRILVYSYFFTNVIEGDGAKNGEGARERKMATCQKKGDGVT